MVTRLFLSALVSFTCAVSPLSEPVRAQQLPALTPAVVTTVASRLVILGTGGGPVPRVRRSQPANLLVSGGKYYLIDAGDGVVRQLAAVGVRPDQIDAIFLSHLHLDHSAGLAPLLGFSWIGARKRPIEVVGPSGTTSFVEAAKDYLETPTALHAIQLPPFTPLDQLVNSSEIDHSGERLIFKDANIAVWGLENNHFAEFGDAKAPHNTRSYAFKFKLPDRTVVFTGDTGYDPALVRFARGADVLVSEVIHVEQTLRYLQERYGLPLSALEAQVAHMSRQHISPDELGLLATEAGVRTVVISHLVMGLDTELDASTYAEGVKKTFRGTVVVATDLLEL